MDTSGLVAYCEEIWNLASEEFPGFRISYPPPIQTERENRFKGYLDKFKKKQEEWKKEQKRPDTAGFFNAFRKFMSEIYDYSDEALSIILHPDMTQVTRSFFEKARLFDPRLKKEEIYQAMRNVWIMNGLQMLLGKKVEITPSIMAYSLLYPYSDNILDDAELSHADKVAFSKRFERRLAGQGTMDTSYREKKISELVGMIEEQYPRALYPEVHGSLMAIHHAQTQSLRLSCREADLTDEEILRISFDKGGCSVLADGFLVAGRLTEEISRFFFGYGVWLQLADDIQDISEDIQNETRTLFSADRDQQKRVRLTNKTFHFGRSILENIKYCNTDVSIPFGKVILQSIEWMMIQSAGTNNGFYPEEYTQNMEPFSPLRFQFLKDTKKKGIPGRLKLITQMMNQE
jgi:hypothetical protein